MPAELIAVVLSAVFPVLLLIVPLLLAVIEDRLPAAPPVRPPTP